MSINEVTTAPRPAVDAGWGTAPTAPRPPACYELSAQDLGSAPADGVHSWFVRAQNVVVGYDWLPNGAVVTEADLVDEHVVLVPEPTTITVRWKDDEVSVLGPALVIVPAGSSTVTAGSTGGVLRVFTSRSARAVARSCNPATYAEPDPAVAPLPALPPVTGPGTLRVLRGADIAPADGRFGRIVRTDSLMVNWFEPQDGPRDEDRLTAHAHADFEQASVTLRGEYVHHLRTPWTARLREWRPDQHLRCASPSVTVIPPGNVHTTRAVGDGEHQLVDVFGSARADFLERGWVLNAADYAAPAPRAER